MADHQVNINTCRVHHFLTIFDREAFGTRRLVMGNSRDWHTLQSCLWRSPFSLANFVDLSTIYPNLESFFVTRLKVKNANPTMLLNEIWRMARESEPRIEEIRLRLIDVGKMVAKSGIDERVRRALERLKEIPFLPKKNADGNSVLVSVNDEFVILDHKRYGEAFAEYSVLLDFTLDQTQILDIVFDFLGLTQHYLSRVVGEVSTVGEDAVVNDMLSRQLQAKAYALYW